MQNRWDTLDRRFARQGTHRFVDQKIYPILRNVASGGDLKENLSKQVSVPAALAMGAFIICFSSLDAILPGGFVGGLLKTLLLPVFFFGSFALVFYFFQDRLVALMVQGQSRFLAKAEAMQAIASWAGITYVPAPGGAPEGLRKFAKSRFANARFKALADTLDRHGGMEAALDIARTSGAITPNVLLIGSDDQKRRALSQQQSVQYLQDGFHGTTNGIAFSAFEWSEPVSDEARLHHLVLVLAAPARLTGTTHLRSHKVPWPNPGPGHDLQPVKLGIDAFEDRYDLRGTDQTEARYVFNPAVIERVIDFAHGADMRAVATDEHIVVDLRGHDRFELIDLLTGAWSETSIETTFKDIADLLDLIDSVAKAFMSPRS